MKANATKTSALQNRISSQKKQSVNLNEWVFNKLSICPNPKILELCCGTGAQTRYLAKMIGNGSMNCVDINQETIDINRKSIVANNINYYVSDIDLVNNYCSKSVNLIFVSYGFYYSKDPISLHKQLYKKLSNNGKFVLVGPTMGNNNELYTIINKIGGVIHNSVLYSSEKFMLEMHKVFLDHYNQVNFYRVLNSIEYNSINELLKYWQNTTFYDASKEKKFISMATDFYGKNRITVTKSVAYLEGVL